MCRIKEEYEEEALLVVALTQSNEREKQHQRVRKVTSTSFGMRMNPR